MKYPEIEVEIIGQDGNAFSILARVSEAMEKAGVPPDEISDFFAEATSGDYDRLLATVVKWVKVR